MYIHAYMYKQHKFKIVTEDAEVFFLKFFDLRFLN